MLPILYILFNRPDRIEPSFAPIRRYRPERLYLAADGPRPGAPNDPERCRLAREKVRALIDWPCDVRTLFRDHNAGCGLHVSSSISWMFESEDSGAIIEDDCVVADEFFPFCQEMLERHRNDPRVAQVNAFVPHPPAADSNATSFSEYPAIWGWATWRRAWRDMDFEMKQWPSLRWRIWSRFPPLEACIHFLLWRGVHQKILRTGRADAWGFQWSIAVMMNRRLCVQPEVNLVENIGFGPDSTHCRHAAPDDPRAQVRRGHLRFPLRHPPEVAVPPRKARADSRAYVRHYAGLLLRRIRRALAPSP